MTIRRVADGDGLGNRIRPHQLRMVEPLLKRVHNRRATGRLGSMNLRQIPVNQTDVPQFAEAAKNARQERPAGHR